MTLPLGFEKMRDAFYGKVVQKVGDRRYLEDWSKDVSNIAHMYIRRIGDLIESNQGAKLAFDKFLNSLHHNINDSITQEDAIEMLAQHLITEPIFDALFGEYSFVKNNVVSKSLNDVISAFKVFGFEKEQEKLKPFYESIKLRASGIDNAAGKQKLIVTLYDKFFSTGFKDTTEQLGIVFTPIEVVDFIIHSVDAALQKYFGKQLADKGVHILDPFTGTGTFITRTLQYLKQQMDEGKATFDDILRKYLHELHANEIVLLSYYIAAINIEAVFDEVNGPDRGYQPFEGIVLTDTFESTERQNSFMDELLGQNNERLKKQQEQPITAIISNPPYSKGQSSESDNNQNVHYSKLETKIRNTYIKESNSNAKNALMDSYVKAFRWASDRIEKKGIIGFVTNGSFLDSNSTDGLRASLYKEFNHLYIFNLRGNARTQGEQRRKEKDNVFGQGTRTPIAISILIKDGSDKHELFYYEIGDYLSRKQKLQTINELESIVNIHWKSIKPDSNSDWINQRDPNYKSYIPLSDSKSSNKVFNDNATGIVTSRDPWVYGFNKSKVINNANQLIENYNNEVTRLKKLHKKVTKDDLNYDPKKLNWSDELKKRALKLENIEKADTLKLISYRPFTKKWLFFDKDLLHRPSKYSSIWGSNNKTIVTNGTGTNKPFSVLITNKIPDYQFIMNGQGFYEFNNATNDLIGQTSNINDLCCSKFELSSDNLFYYCYGVLNSKDYQAKYANDLKKDLARIPIVKNKEQYIKIGKKLVELHLNYEKAEPYKGVNLIVKGEPNYRVKKMNFAKKRNQETNKLEKDYSTIIFNDSITIKDIPLTAYDYIVNGRSAIEWIMDQYQVHDSGQYKKAGIVDDPNDFSDDPKYIFNLLLRIITVSLKTIDLINQLPRFEVDNDA